MPSFHFRRPLILLVGMWCLAVGAAQAAPVHEVLLPATTQGYFTADDVERLGKNWDQTQLAQLIADPVMKPFVDDMQKQLQNRFSRLHAKLGLTVEDLRGVPGGETSLAVIQPAPNQAALAILVDITGHQAQADALLAKIDGSLTRQQSTKQQKTAHGVNLTVYTLPPKEGRPGTRTAVFFVHENTLCGADNLAIAEGIAGRFAGGAKDNLASQPAYVAVMERVAQSLPELPPDIRWWMNPFGYAETMRAADLGQEKKKGKDMLKILASQGFTAIQGVGGYVSFYVKERYELLHRTAIYAPPAADAKAGERYTLAARLLQFPNGGDLNPPAWAPRDLATYVSFNIKTQEAFEYSKTLVDAIVGEEGVFEDVIDSIEHDPNGPQINLRRDLVAYLGTRATVLSDYTLPINPKSERLVVAVEAINPGPLAVTIEKTMKTDPDAQRVEFGKHVIWEIVESRDDLQPPQLQFDGFDPIGKEEDGEQKRKLPNSAVAVAHGQLFVATHIDFLKKVLTEVEARETLAQAFDYDMVMKDLDQLQPGPHSLRAFSRTEESSRPTYELIRAGKMPESQTLFGKLLNALLTEGEEGEIRPQRIKGENLPDFERVRRYFGPSGLTMLSEDNGWFVLGVMMKKDAE